MGNGSNYAFSESFQQELNTVQTLILYKVLRNRIDVPTDLVINGELKQVSYIKVYGMLSGDVGVCFGVSGLHQWRHCFLVLLVGLFVCVFLFVFGLLLFCFVLFCFVLFFVFVFCARHRGGKICFGEGKNLKYFLCHLSPLGCMCV